MERLISVVFWILLIPCFLVIVPSGNEEHYLGVARAWYLGLDNAFCFGDPPGNRLLYQVVMGVQVASLPFEFVVFVWRLGFSALFIILFGELSGWDWMLPVRIGILALFQGFVGGEFVLLSVEPKTFAYGLLLIHFWSWHKHGRSYFALIAGAMLFHWLIAFWYFVLWVCCSDSVGRFLKRACYGLLFPPVVWFLYFGSEPLSAEALSIYMDWADHHLTPWKHWGVRVFVMEYLVLAFIALAINSRWLWVAIAISLIGTGLMLFVDERLCVLYWYRQLALGLMIGLMSARYGIDKIALIALLPWLFWISLGKAHWQVRELMKYPEEAAFVEEARKSGGSVCASNERVARKLYAFPSVNDDGCFLQKCIRTDNNGLIEYQRRFDNVIER
jgi:hypothetical protein